jgi:7-carboxy-7-deazaguanine synthase
MAELLSAPTVTVAVDEIFFSLQGEGLELGRPHLFLRLGGCPLRCDYCDTPRSWKVQAQVEIHGRAGTRQIDNSVSSSTLHQMLHGVLEEHGASAHNTMLSVTGGEPLLQADFLKAWLPHWPGRVLLETAGVYADRLAALLPEIDLLSLDWKLPSNLEQGQHLVEAEACLRAAVAANTPTQLKIVVDESTPDDELAQALRGAAAIAPEMTVLLQPVTHIPGGPRPPAAERLLEWVLAYQELPLDMRVMPQMHPLLGLR